MSGEVILAVLGVVQLLVIFFLVYRVLALAPSRDVSPLVREEFRAVREETARQARELREEVGRGHKESLDSLITNLSRLGALQQDNLKKIVEAQREFENTVRQSLTAHFTDSIQKQNKFFADIRATLQGIVDSNREEAGKNRDLLDGQLRDLRSSNEKKLEEMRQTVDEKLHSTLEKRLGESFKQVSDHLQAVQQGLGEMRNLASGVGDLKRVLTNVKTRGTWGEVQLGAILEQLLTPDQYQENVSIRKDTRVEYAIRLPGRGPGEAEALWLPIDAKFPKESYERLVDASQAGDTDGVNGAQAALVAEISRCAADIQKKYVAPPATTDFAIMYLPTEGLYAEVLRQPGLHDRLQNEFRVVPAGPTTLSAILNSLRMGFRTLAIEKRSSEVWQVLSAVKTEFGRFGEVLDKVKGQLETASNTIDRTKVRTRAMERKLKNVETLPDDQARELLELSPADDEGDIEDEG